MTGRIEAYVERGIQGCIAEFKDTSEGSRNHDLFRTARRAAELAAHIGGATDTVRDLFTDMADEAGLDHDEISKTIASAFNGAEPADLPADINDAPMRNSVLDAFGTAQSPGIGGERNTDEQVRHLLPLVDWHQLWADDTDEEWIIDPLLPARRLIALYSAPKVGKSLLMLELAVAISMGTEALGHDIDRPRKVLYVDFENDPRGDVRARLQAMGHGPDDLAGLCYLSFPTLAALDTERGAKELLAAITTYECEVVVIDTVSRSVEGDENENDTWLGFYRHTGLRLKQAGVAMVRLDHSGKDETKGQRGGSAKVGDVDAVWRLSRLTNGDDGNLETFRLTCEANRFPITEKLITLVREETPRLWHRVNPRGSKDAIVGAIVNYLDEEGVPLDAGRDGLYVAVKLAVPGTSQRMLDEAIKQRRARPLQGVTGVTDEVHG